MNKKIKRFIAKKVMDATGKGNHGHSGRSGKVGGSAPSNNTPVERDKVKEHLGTINVGKDMYTDIGTFNKYVNKALENDNLNDYFGSFKDQSTLDTFNKTLTNLLEASKKDPTDSTITDQLKKMSYSLNRLVMAKEVAQKIRDERAGDANELASEKQSTEKEPIEEVKPDIDTNKGLSKDVIKKFASSVEYGVDLFAEAYNNNSRVIVPSVHKKFTDALRWSEIQEATGPQKQLIISEAYAIIDKHEGLNSAAKSYLKGDMNNIYIDDAIAQMTDALGPITGNRMAGVAPRGNKRSKMVFEGVTVFSNGKPYQATMNSNFQDLPTLMTFNGFAYTPVRLRHIASLKLACITNVTDNREATRFENIRDSGRDYDSLKVGSTIELDAQHFTSSLEAFPDSASMFGGQHADTRVKFSVVGPYPSLDLEQFVYAVDHTPKSMNEYEKLIAGNFKVVSLQDNRKKKFKGNSNKDPEAGMLIGLEYDWDNHNGLVQQYKEGVDRNNKEQKTLGFDKIKSVESKFFSNYILDSKKQLAKVGEEQGQSAVVKIEPLIAANITKYLEHVLKPYNDSNMMLSNIQKDIDTKNARINKIASKPTMSSSMLNEISKLEKELLSLETDKIKYDPSSTTSAQIQQNIDNERERYTMELLSPIINMLPASKQAKVKRMEPTEPFIIELLRGAK